MTSETVVIPENGENDTETVNASYELTYYVNNVNTENTQVLMEYGKRDELKSVYTYGLNRISVETIADIYNPALDEFETDYYLYDGRGSVANVVTDSSEIVASYSYDPFGNITKGALAFDCFYGYNAEETNPVTGFQYLRARYYDTETGRFGTADTYLGVVTDPLTLNRYAYTVNNPVMQIDPSGHWPKWLDKAANKVKSAVSTVATGVKKAVNTVKTEVKKVAKAVNENVIKPVVKTVKSAAQWTKDNIIKPAATFVKEKVIEPISKVKDTAVEKITKVAETVYEGYQEVKQVAVKSYQDAKAYAAKKVEKAKEAVKKFACGTAEKLSNAWEATVDFVKDIDWAKVGQVAVVVGVGVISVAAVVCSAGAAGAAIGAIAGMYLGAGAVATATTVGTVGAYCVAGGIAAYTLSDAGEIITDGHNVIRDDLMGGNQELYDTTKLGLNMAAGEIVYLADMYNSLNSGSSSKTTTSNATADVADDVADDATVTIGGSSVENGSKKTVDVELKYKDGWTDTQKAEADKKINALSNAKTVKTPVSRSGTSASSRYKSVYGSESVPSGYDVDHTIELQLGGADNILNMDPLDMSVNRSLGVQIKNAIKDYPYGTEFGQFKIK